MIMKKILIQIILTYQSILTGLRKWKTPNLPEIGDYYINSLYELDTVDVKEQEKRQIISVRFRKLKPFSVICGISAYSNLEFSYEGFKVYYIFYRKPKETKYRVLNTGETICTKEMIPLSDMLHAQNAALETILQNIRRALLGALVVGTIVLWIISVLSLIYHSLMK